MGEGIDYSAVTRTELVWPGKRTQVERVALPFQVVETVNQSRATREQTPMLGLIPPPLFEGLYSQDNAWKNKLIWGDNKYVMASLLQGDPSIGLEPLAGKIDLIYIDPPFATGQDFSYRVRVGDEEWVKQASVVEETAYRDTWGKGLDSYLQMMYDRLVLMRELLEEHGSIYVHIGWDISHRVKLVLDEVFGPDRLLNEIVWKRQAAHSDSKQGAQHYGRLHDTIFVYTKSENYAWNQQYQPYDDDYLKTFYSNVDGNGRRFQYGDITGPGGPAKGNPVYEFLGVTRAWRYSRDRMEELYRQGRIEFRPEGKVPRIKRYLDEAPGLPVQDIWDDVSYGSLINFGKQNLGYPTQKPESVLERIIKTSCREGGVVLDCFVGSGTTLAVAEKLGRRWIGCDLSRYAVQVTRKRLLDIRDCKFQVLNLGKYERRHWQVHVNGSGRTPEEIVSGYQGFIVGLHHAEPVTGYKHLHGQKVGRWVHVGATDVPVTRAEVMDAVRECQAHRYTALDVLGWEWEMGLHDTVREEARRMGVDVRLLVIPREVMDTRAVQAGDVHFYELAYLKASPAQEGRMVTVKLEDFLIPNPDLVPDEVRSKIKKWSDYIDFWAVDWNYRDDTFHNEWQDYRTRKSPTLRLVSDPHVYQEPGKYRILVKVIDIFGNDTTQLLEVKVS